MLVIMIYILTSNISFSACACLFIVLSAFRCDLGKDHGVLLAVFPKLFGMVAPDDMAAQR